MKKLLLALILIPLLGILSCQEEEDLEVIDDVDTITRNSGLTSLIARISKNPTAFDDFIDQNPATRVEFPFSVTVNSSDTYTLTETSDYQLLIQNLEDTSIQDDIAIDFPVEVSLPNYQILSVNNADELQNINWDSFDTTEVDCISIEYPIEIYIYNDINVEQDEVDITSDQELYDFLNTMPSEDFFYQIEYPIDVFIEAQEVEINDATALDDQINNLPQNCFEPLLYDNQPSQGGGNDDDVEALTNFITDGTFVVSFLTDDGEEVNEFTNLFFQFSTDNTILVDDQDVDDIFDPVGQWSIVQDDGALELILEFDDSDFGEMDDDWQVVDFSNGVTLSLIDESSDGDDDELLLNKL
ncbi:MAG: hypothetical protein RI535_08335 [Psychroflexus sp.]|nr:hypothetical protein [Psychroflexus sp.]